MLDFSIIKNEKLRNLMQASGKFKYLSEFQQQQHLQGMQNLTPEQEEKACKFFAEENSKENVVMSNEEKLEILNRLYNEFTAMKEKFTKLLKKEPESKQREQDGDDMNNLLSTLNK